MSDDSVLKVEPIAVTTSGADQPYWDALATGTVELQHCVGCGLWHWPAVWRCGTCGSWDHAWSEVAAEGTIYTWTRTWHPFGGTESIGVPFVSLVVTVDGAQARRLTGVLEGEETGLRIGARVSGRIAETDAAGRRIPALRWRLAS